MIAGESILPLCHLLGCILHKAMQVGLLVKFVLAPCYGSEYCHMQHGCAYFTAKSFSNNSSESLAPSSDNHTDLFFVAGFEI